MLFFEEDMKAVLKTSQDGHFTEPPITNKI